jgi:nicotinate-nucleotide pyrophosphorylase (carboxylating)
MTSKTFGRSLSQFVVEQAVKQALEEDLAHAGDVTTDAIIPAALTATAHLNVRQSGRIAGLQCAKAAFLLLDPMARFETRIRDGERAEAGDVIAEVSANARAILAGERVALNFLCHLSGIATLTNRYVERIHGTRAHICCTRKTLPGLRTFQKYAVRAGGGMNHRFGLYDAVLIKDNHIALAGGIDTAIERVRAHCGHMVKIEVEVETLEQVERALRHPIDAILLDNMDTVLLTEAVRLIDGRIITEASGGVTLDTVGSIAGTGVDLISVGALTHSSTALDIGLDFAV